MEAVSPSHTFSAENTETVLRTARIWLHRVSCALFGHAVDNQRFAVETSEKTCGCGEAILKEDGSITRTRHTLSCFFGGHAYVRSGTRDGHNEYVCQQCGHPLLFEAAHDPYAKTDGFEKKVRYLCNLLGHESHVVTARHGLTEYACGCGHTFLRKESGLSLVTHPPVCTFLGHFIRFVESRDGYSEHGCLNCGHTFGFTQGRTRRKGTL
jgi:hypothetical protein